MRRSVVFTVLLALVLALSGTTPAQAHEAPHLRGEHPRRVPPWQIYHIELLASLVWQTAGICQSLLATDRTETDRQVVRDRVVAFNTVLQQECANLAKCRFDDNTVFNYQFTRSQVSPSTNSTPAFPAGPPCPTKPGPSPGGTNRAR